MQIEPDSQHQPHHQLAASSVLPLFDSLFGVALTLLAYTLPEHLNSLMDAQALASSICTYILTGVAVIIYWYKLRRLIDLSRHLRITQLLYGMASLLLIVLMPRLAQLVVLHGTGSGDLWHWTPAQIINSVFLGCLLLFDGICLAYAMSLLQRSEQDLRSTSRISTAIKAQAAGFTALLFLGFLELASTSFNNEYVLAVPLILLTEEWWVGQQLKRTQSIP
jgi:uncharacterized membrane protein